MLAGMLHLYASLNPSMTYSVQGLLAAPLPPPLSTPVPYYIQSTDLHRRPISQSDIAERIKKHNGQPQRCPELTSTLLHGGLVSSRQVTRKKSMKVPREYQSVCPVVRTGSADPLSRKRVCPPPPEPERGGACG
jgi:hypothetical protein